MAGTLELSSPSELESKIDSDFDDDDDGDETGDEELEEIEFHELDGDLFGFAVAALIRDYPVFEGKKLDRKLRLARLFMSQALVLFNIGLQVYVLICIKLYVTAKAVHDIRHVYSRYEMVMYGCEAHPDHCTKTVNGFYRGIGGPKSPNFVHANFESVEEDDQSLVCRVAFSQPYFYMVILAIWSLTCLGDIKRTLELFTQLVWKLDTTPHMYEEHDRGDLREHHQPVILERENAEDDFSNYKKKCVKSKLADLSDNDRLVVGLSRMVKLYLTIVIFLPRFLIVMVLLWLGCRWLTATTSFVDILLNAVALEFILLLKDLLFATVVPMKNKDHVKHTLILPELAQEENGEYTFKRKGNWAAYFGSFTWLFITLAWVLFYVYWFQMVLPHYNWDVHDVCTKWIAARYALTAPTPTGTTSPIPTNTTL